MSIAALVRSMIEAGAPAEAIALAVEAVEAAQAKVDAVREGARVRKQRQRDKSRDCPVTVTADVTPLVLPLPPSPRTPQPPTPAPGLDTTRARDGGFEVFWAEYPRKVGKPKAALAYAKALRGVPGPDPPGVILAGLRAHLPAWAEIEPDLVPHPTTWLNRDGWNDHPPQPRRPRPANDRPDSKLEARNANYERSFAGARLASGGRDELLGGG